MRVLMSPAYAADQTNPFVQMLVESLRERGVAVERFSWSAALFSRYEVLHVHWPEALLRSHGRLGRLVKPAALLALLALRPVARRHHVSTIHNPDPHEGGTRLERALVRRWLASCELRVYLTQAGLDASGDPRGVVVPHGDYAPTVERFAPAASGAVVDGRLLMFGQLREYKGVESLIEAFGGLRDEGLTLRILGRASSAGYAARLAARARGVDGLTLAPDRALPDEELIGEIAAAEVVVLPYRSIYNSGAAFLALTVGRPLVVTRSPSMLELQRELGPHWVQVLDGALGPDTLGRAVRGLRAVPREARPPLTGRDWGTVAALYESAYRRAVGHD